MLKLQFIIIFPNYNTVILFSTQTMHRLKQLLDKNNFTYTEKTFESEEDIAGLGSEPFVSDSRTIKGICYVTFYHITSFTTGSQYQDLYHCNVRCPCKTSAV